MQQRAETHEPMTVPNQMEMLMLVETAHLACMNSTLIQFLQFARQMLSLSKTVIMHNACLDLSLHRSNMQRASLLIRATTNPRESQGHSLHP